MKPLTALAIAQWEFSEDLLPLMDESFAHWMAENGANIRRRPSGLPLFDTWTPPTADEIELSIARRVRRFQLFEGAYFDTTDPATERLLRREAEILKDYTADHFKPIPAINGRTS